MSTQSLPGNAPPPKLPGVLAKLLIVYKLWREYQRHIPTLERYSIGVKTDSIFVELIEAVTTANFLSKEQKLPYISRAVIKLDVLRFFLQLLWDMKSIDTKKFISLSELLEEVGKMLGGWKNQITKNSLPTLRREREMK